MQLPTRFALIFASNMLAFPACAAGSLDALFEQETGKSSSARTVAPHAMARPKAGNLDSLLEQEQQEEFRQRQIAEDKRKAEEARQRQIAEEKRRQDESRRVADTRQREIAAQQASEEKRRQSVKDAGIFGAVMSFATGNNNLGAVGVVQAITGEEVDDATLQQAANQDAENLREKERQKQEAIRQQNEAQLRQQEANRRQVEENNRRVAAQQQQPGRIPCNAPAGVQCATDGNSQQEQHQNPAKVWPVPSTQWCKSNPNSENPYCANLLGYNSQEQEQHQESASVQRKNSRKSYRTANECIQLDPSRGFFNNSCSFRVLVTWQERGGYSSGSVSPPAGGQATISRIKGSYDFAACEHPGTPRNPSDGYIAWRPGDERFVCF